VEIACFIKDGAFYLVVFTIFYGILIYGLIIVNQSQSVHHLSFLKVGSSLFLQQQYMLSYTYATQLIPSPFFSMCQTRLSASFFALDGPAASSLLKHDFLQRGATLKIRSYSTTVRTIQHVDRVHPYLMRSCADHPTICRHSSFSALPKPIQTLPTCSEKLSS
jgi:hypothetical protein